MRLLLVLWGAFLVLAPAAATADSTFMDMGGRTSQPIGHYEFCQKYQAECMIKTDGTSRVRLTPKLWNELVVVNANVNLAITPATDEEIYGLPEVWAYPTTVGDCEDIVLLKRRDLIEKGWSVGALLITVVRQANGEGHAVLTVLTDRGDLVLDSLQPRVLVWSDTSYHYVKRQSETNSGQWRDINDNRGLTSSIKK